MNFCLFLKSLLPEAHQISVICVTFSASLKTLSNVGITRMNFLYTAKTEILPFLDNI